MRVINTTSISEIKVFAEQLAIDAKDGHFDSQHESAEFNELYIKHIVKTNSIIGYPVPGKSDVFTFLVNEKPVAFAIVCPAFLPSFSKEILFFTTLSESRKSGHGSKAIKTMLDRINEKNVLARCMPKSKVMVDLLKGVGFEIADLPSKKNTNLVHPNC